MYSVTGLAVRASGVVTRNRIHNPGQHTLALKAETIGLDIGIRQAVREVHDALRIGTMIKAKEMPKLVNTLFENATAQEVLIRWPPVELLLQPDYRDDAHLPDRISLPKYKVQRWYEEIHIA